MLFILTHFTLYTNYIQIYLFSYLKNILNDHFIIIMLIDKCVINSSCTPAYKHLFIIKVLVLGIVWDGMSDQGSMVGCSPSQARVSK